MIERWKQDSNLEEIEYVYSFSSPFAKLVRAGLVACCNYLPKDIVKSPILDDFSEHDLLDLTFKCNRLVSIGWKSGSSARKRLLQNRRIAYVVWNILYGYALIQSLSPLVGVRRKWHRFTTRYNFRSEVCNMAYIHQKGLINIQIFRDDQPVTYLHPSVAKWDD